MIPMTKGKREKDQTWVTNNLAQLGDIAVPTGRERRVIITGLTRFGFWAKAKVYQGDYFPAFTHRLAELGVDCHFVWTDTQLLDLVTGENTAIIHLFNEEKPFQFTPPMLQAQQRAGFVFCTPRAASIISNKLLANQFLTSQDIPMPRLIEDSQNRGMIFSNSVIGSGKRVMVTKDPSKLDKTVLCVDTTASTPSTLR